MSAAFSYYSSPEEYEQQKQQHMEMLRAKAQLDDEYEQATLLARQAINLQPVLKPTQSPAELEANLNSQRQILRQNLVGIMRPEEIQTFIDMFDVSELTKLNKNFPAFQKSLSGRIGIDAVQLYLLWLRFELELDGVNLTEAQIAEVNNNVNTLANAIKPYFTTDKGFEEFIELVRINERRQIYKGVKPTFTEYWTEKKDDVPIRINTDLQKLVVGAKTAPNLFLQMKKNYDFGKK